MSRHLYTTAMANAALLAAATMTTTLTSPAQAAPRMSTWSVICADGTDLSVSAPAPPSGMSVCGDHGYNGGIIKAAGPGKISAEVAPRVDAAGWVRSEDASAAGDATAVGTAATAAGVATGGPRDDGDNPVPVLNCSNSPNNPPSILLTTAPGTWILKNPANAAVPLNTNLPPWCR